MTTLRVAFQKVILPIEWNNSEAFCLKRGEQPHEQKHGSGGWGDAWRRGDPILNASARRHKKEEESLRTRGCGTKHFDARRAPATSDCVVPTTHQS